MNWKRQIFLALILTATLLLYFFGAADWVTFEKLQEHHMTLKEYVNENFITASCLFIATYLLSTTLSLPFGIWLSLLGGYLFPQPYAALYVITGATLGASTLFFAAKYALTDILKEKAGPFLKKMEKGFHENAASYLLFIRLVPAFPFWLCNLAPAFLGARFFTFFWTTAVGILPGVIAFTQFGKSLAVVLESGKEIEVSDIFSRDLQIALGALAVVVLIPIVYKWIKKKNDRPPLP